MCFLLNFAVVAYNLYMNKLMSFWLTLTFGMILLVSIYSFYVDCFPLKYESTILNYSHKYDVDSALVFAIVKAESKFNDRAVSKVGAKGLMQLMESTAEYVADIYDININEREYLFNVRVNVELGCAYLNYLFERFENFEFVICAYNAGEGRVNKWIEEGVINKNDFKKIPFKETSDYLNKVRFNYGNYKNRLK